MTLRVVSDEQCLPWAPPLREEEPGQQELHRCPGAPRARGQSLTWEDGNLP